jgi:2-polyprenyl-6-methoxyphenol hydroxylase-like FAD-dependent oxidoreductase
MYEAIIVGARCAGAATAMLLARRGHRVLLVDKGALPSDLPQGHFIHKDGPRRLQRWGLLDRIVASNCPPVDVQTLDFGDFPLTARDLVIDGVAWGYGPRRKVFDQILLEAAMAAGVEVRDRFAVDRFTGSGERITGIVGHALPNGDSVSECACITIGADGRRSALARAVSAAEYDAAPPLVCYYFSYWSGVEYEGFEGYYRKANAVFSHPTSDGLHAVFAGWPMSELPAVRRDIERSFMSVIGTCGSLRERLDAGRREERFYGATDLPNFYRTPFGPGWALVGDAGHHKDPWLALGMSDALRDAELLAEALDHVFRGADEAATMRAYQRRRDEASIADYRQNLYLASFKPLPREVMEVRAEIRGDAEQTRLHAMMRVGMIPALASAS